MSRRSRKVLLLSEWHYKYLLVVVLASRWCRQRGISTWWFVWITAILDICSFYHCRCSDATTMLALEMGLFERNWYCRRHSAGAGRGSMTQELFMYIPRCAMFIMVAVWFKFHHCVFRCDRSRSTRSGWPLWTDWQTTWRARSTWPTPTAEPPPSQVRILHE
jgi:hypothetical protein